MGKRKGDQPNSPAPDVAANEPVKIAPAAVAAEGPGKIEAPELVAAAPSVAAAPADAVAPPAPPPPPPIAAIDATKLEAMISAPPVAPTTPIEPAPAKSEAIAPEAVESAAIESAAIEPAPIMSREPAAPAAAASWAWLKTRRVTPLAASIAVAAVVGAMAGSVATAGLGGLWAGPPPAKTADVRPLSETIARINTELAALKASIENSGRTANSQFTRLGDRLDRVEHAQAEPAAKLAKLTEVVSKLEHRAPVNADNDVTGAIAAPKPGPATAVPVRPGPPILDGWVVRSVYNGAALIQARYGGVIAVEPGDSLPQLGRIENIRRQDGRWVVLTSRGMIVAR